MDSSVEVASPAENAAREDLAVDSFGSSAFEEVAFVGIRSSYPPSEDIEVQFSVGQAVETSSRDWIGLYKVGWKTPKDYYTFEWAPSRNEDTELSSVVFQARRLPRDENSSFQFCYVTKSNEVRGVSTPFQVKDYVDEDLECVEVQDDNLESLVLVNSRTTESRIEQYREKNALLESTMEQTKQEYSVLQEQLQKAENCVTTMEDEKQLVLKQLEEARRVSSDQADRLSRTDKRVLHLQTELENALKDNASLQEKLRNVELSSEQAAEKNRVAADENATEIGALQQAKEALQAELQDQTERRAAAEELIASLEQECIELKSLQQEQNDELAVSRILADESRENLAQMQQCNEELTTKLSECQKLVEEKDAALKELEAALDREVTEARTTVGDLESERSALKIRLNELEQQFDALRIAQESSSSDIAQCNIVELVGERTELVGELALTRERVAQLEDELSKPKPVDDGALYALRHAYNHSEQQREELVRERDTLRQQLRVQRAQQAAVQSLEAEVTEMRGKCQDFERRLELGAQAYKEKFLEWHTCNKQLEKLRDQQSLTTMSESEQVQQLTQQLADVKNELARVEGQCRTFETAVASQTEERDRMEQEHASAIAALRAENDSKIAELTSELEEHKSDLEECRQQCDDQHNLIQQLTESVRTQQRPVMYDRARPTPQYPQHPRDRPTVAPSTSDAPTRCCPVCDVVFPPAKTQAQFEEHVASHFE